MKSASKMTSELCSIHNAKSVIAWIWVVIYLICHLKLVLVTSKYSNMIYISIQGKLNEHACLSLHTNGHCAI